MSKVKFTTAGEVVLKPAAAVAAPKVTVFDKDTVETYKDFDTMIKTFKARIKEQDKNQLLLNWELGGQMKLLTEGATYGSRTIQDAADKFDCSDSTLYSVRRLFETYPKDMIDKFIAKGLHYHTIAQLLGKNADPEVRKSIENKLLSGQVSNKDLPELLGKAVKPKKEVKDVKVEVMDDEDEDEDNPSEDAEEDDAIPVVPAIEDPNEELDAEVRNAKPGDPKAKVVNMMRAVDMQVAQMTKTLLTVDPMMDAMEDVEEPADIEKLMLRVGSSMANLQKLNMRISEVCARMKRMAM